MCPGQCFHFSSPNLEWLTRFDSKNLHPRLAGPARINYTGASPQWADACLGSAHARSDRGCRQIEAVNATVLPLGALKIKKFE